MNDAENNLKTYRIDLMYIGTSFCGWQSQPDGNSVQDRLEKALNTILQQNLRLTGASRTDSGVHAMHQVATFRTPIEIDAYSFRKSLNALTPDDIGVRSVSEVSPQFHPITSAKGKAYRYRLLFERYHHPFLSNFSWQVPNATDHKLILDNIQKFAGTHDFTSFCAVDSAAKTKTRTIFEIKCDVHDGLTDIWIIGDGFLKQMVRTMVGTLVDIACGQIKTDISGLIDAKDRTVAGQSAPSQGLSLAEIFYDDIPSANVLIERVNRNCGFSFL